MERRIIKVYNREFSEGFFFKNLLQRPAKDKKFQTRKEFILE